MTAIVFGILTALMWTNSNLCSAPAVRFIPEYSVVAWVTLVGLLITTPFAVAVGVPPALDAARVVGLAVVGVAVVIGLVLLYGAFRFGKVALIAPIGACEGAVSALISAAFGESLAPIAAVLLVVVVGAVGLSVVAPDPQPVADERPLRAAAMATAAAGCFGVAIYLSGRFSGDLPLAWVIMLPRIFGTLVLFLPLALTRRLRLSRKAVPLLAATGASEVLGYLTLGLGAVDSIAITSVLASQVATFSVIGGRVLFHERLGRVQVLGIAVLIAAVTGLALVAAR